MAARAGLEVRMGDYEIEARAADEEEKDILKASKVLQVARVIEAEDRPVAYLIDILAESVVNEAELREEFTGSVLDLLLKRGKPQVRSSDTEIQATAVESNVARALRIQRGDVVLHFRSSLFSLDGAVMSITRSYFLPGYFRFRVLRRVGR
jgi:GntR family transcriptional regulator